MRRELRRQDLQRDLLLRHPVAALEHDAHAALPEHIDAVALLPKAVEAGMAYVPGAAFYASDPRKNTLRLSFVTSPPEKVEAGVAALARVLKAAS